MPVAKLDQNSRPTLIALSTANDGSIVTLWADPTTHRLLVDLPSIGGGITSINGDSTAAQLITGANGIGVSNSTPGTTALSLGVITPTSVNGLTLTAQAIGFTISGGTTSKTLTVPLDASVSGTNTGDQTNISGNAGTVTTNANLTGVITSVGNTTTRTLLANSNLNLAEGVMSNGQIVPSVSSGNLTVALKTLAGTDPSATDPVYVRIGGVVRVITGALSTGASAGYNVSNCGSAELATKEVDFPTYIGFDTSNSTLYMAFSRYFGTIGTDFSATYNNEKWISSNNANATTTYANIGRFAATLSAGAGYTWSVPTFTASNLINRPIYETRQLTWSPQFSASGSMTIGTITVYDAEYLISGTKTTINLRGFGTTAGSASNVILATLPFTGASIVGYFGGATLDGGSSNAGLINVNDDSSGKISFHKSDNSNFGIGATRGGFVQASYLI